MGTKFNSQSSKSHFINDNGMLQKTSFCSLSLLLVLSLVTLQGSQIFANDSINARLPLPPLEELRQTYQLLREVYRLDIDQTRVDSKMAQQLSDEMYHASILDNMRPAERVLLLQASIRYAGLLGDVFRVTRGLRTQSEIFQIEFDEILAHELQSIADRVRCPRAREEMSRAYKGLAQRHTLRRDLSKAEDAARKSLLFARQADEQDLIRKLLRYIRGLRIKQREFDQAKSILARTPGDSPAKRVIGEFLCLSLGDWEAGIIYLVNAELSPLHEGAKREAESQGKLQVEKGLDLGDYWWEIASRYRGEEAFFIRSRAVYWYRKVYDETENKDRRRVKDRLRVYQQERGDFTHLLFMLESRENSAMTRQTKLDCLST